MSKITRITKNLGGVLSKNSPHILTGLGCAGLMSTAILTAKATPKALSILKEEEIYREKKNFIPLSKFEEIKLTWKCYIPAGVVGIATMGCIVGANTVNARRNAAIASLYAISETAFRDYKSKVVEEIGKTKETKIRDEVIKDHIDANPPSSNVIIAGSGDVLCYDLQSGRYFMSSYETIRQKMNDLNYELRSEMRLTLNDLYYALNLPSIELGNLMGFDLDKGQIEPIYSTQLDNTGKPCLVIDYDVYPIY